MRCERCHGDGLARESVTLIREPILGSTTVFTENMNYLIPCPDCGGSGISHCCDGLTACNEVEESEE